MPFSTSKKSDTAAVVVIKGKFLGSLEREGFNAAIDDLKASGVKNVVVDLSKAEFLDSTALGLIMRSLTTMRSAGGDVRLAGLNVRVKNLFLITKLLGPVFEDHETADEALAAF